MIDTDVLNQLSLFTHLDDSQLYDNNEFQDDKLNEDTLNSLLDETNLGDINDSSKYANLGLSLNSQELILEFYQELSNQDPLQVKGFERLLYAVLDDLQKYRKDLKRIEKSYKSERDKNEETMKSMIEEAENQLATIANNIRQTERAEYEKLVEKLKDAYESEIISLQENLSKMQAAEKKNQDNKIEEENYFNDLKRQLETLKEINRELSVNLRASQTEISILRSEIAELKEAEDEKIYRSNCAQDALQEINVLKHEIRVLHNANKKLNDTNELLRNELDICKTKGTNLPAHLKSLKNHSNHLINDDTYGLEHYQPTPISTNSRNSRYSYGKFLPKNNSSIQVQSSFESDEEIDSGYLALNNELSDYQLESPENSIINCSNELSDYFNKGIDNSFKEDTPSIPSPITSNPPESTVSVKTVNENTTPERMFKIVFAGDSAVGKTSFIMRYCKGEFVKTSSTLGIDFHMKVLDLDGKKIALQLWDTCGQERFRSMANSYFRRADGVVLMYDCSYERSFLNIREWVSKINESSDKPIPIVIIGNKIDLRDEALVTNKRVIEYEEGAKLAKEYDSLFIETSTKDGSNMEQSLTEICRIMSKNQDAELKLDSIRLKLDGQKKKKNCC